MYVTPFFLVLFFAITGCDRNIDRSNTPSRPSKIFTERDYARFAKDLLVKKVSSDAGSDSSEDVAPIAEYALVMSLVRIRHLVHEKSSDPVPHVHNIKTILKSSVCFSYLKGKINEKALECLNRLSPYSQLIRETPSSIFKEELERLLTVGTNIDVITEEMSWPVEFSVNTNNPTSRGFDGIIDFYLAGGLDQY